MVTYFIEVPMEQKGYNGPYTLWDTVIFLIEVGGGKLNGEIRQKEA